MAKIKNSSIVLTHCLRLRAPRAILKTRIWVKVGPRKKKDRRRREAGKGRKPAKVH